MLTLTSVTPATNSTTTAAGYDDFLYQVQSVPTPTTFILTLTQQETNAGATVPGSASGTVNPYEIVGPAAQTYGYCLLYTSPSPRDGLLSRMPSSA